MNKLLLLLLLICISACEKKEERILPKISPTEQIQTEEKSWVEREEFIRQAQKEIDELLLKLADIRKRSAAATGKAKEKLNQQVLSLEQEHKGVEEKLANLKAAIGEKWKELRSGVTAAIEQFEKSVKGAS